MNIDKALYKVLNEIGIPANMLGREYLATAIKTAYRNKEVPKIGKLYEQVATIHGTTKPRTERNIRFAIERAFNNGVPDVMDKYFGNTIDIDSGKTDNSVFICSIARYLQLFEDELEI